MKTKLFILLALTLISITSNLYANMSTVPNVLTAPVVLYDEGGNPLEDGSYTVLVSLKDYEGHTLYDEEQQVEVVNHVVSLLIGQGYVPGSSLSAPAGGLTKEIFDVQGDVTVEIQVSGVQNAQETAILTSQPYSFISEKALTVSDAAITTHSIKDGTITADDLNESFLDELKSSQLVNEDGETITAKSIPVTSDANFANSGSSNVQGVLKDFDLSINAIKQLDVGTLGTDVDELSTTLSTHMNNQSNPHGVTASQISAAPADHNHDGRYLKLDGSSPMQGHLNLGGHDITNLGSVSSLSTTVADIQDDIVEIQNAADASVNEGEAVSFSSIEVTGSTANPDSNTLYKNNMVFAMANINAIDHITSPTLRTKFNITSVEKNSSSPPKTDQNPEWGNCTYKLTFTHPAQSANNLVAQITQSAVGIPNPVSDDAVYIAELKNSYIIVGVANATGDGNYDCKEENQLVDLHVVVYGY